jgi:hypothetical protein
MSQMKSYQTCLAELKQSLEGCRATLRETTSEDRKRNGDSVVLIAQALERGELSVARGEALESFCAWAAESLCAMPPEALAALPPELSGQTTELKALLQAALAEIRAVDAPTEE